MKRILSIIAFAYAGYAIAQVPGTLSYQGILTDATGNPVVDGAQTILFNFYAVASGGAVIEARGPLTLTSSKGLFTAVIGNGQGTNNAALPFNLGDQQVYVGIVANGGLELAPRVQLTAVPYAFRAAMATALDATATVAGTQIGTGINATNITTGTLSGILVGTGVNGANIGMGINASNVNAGTLALVNGGTGATSAVNARVNLGLAIGSNVQAYDSDLDDLADGSLTGSKVGTGVNASNISTGTLPTAVLPVNSLVPIGTIVAFAGISVPTGWLLCDGSSVSRTTYSSLFTALSVAWGGGDGSTTFNLPDLRGRFIRGKDGGMGNDPDAASRTALFPGAGVATGDNVGSYQNDAFQGHWHQQRVVGAFSSGSTRATGMGNDQDSNNNGVWGPITDGVNGAPRVSAETRSKNVYVNFIIRAQ